MTAAGVTAGAAVGLDLPALADDLLAQLMRQPWGQTSASVYETGRVVSLAPWLAGHRDRLDWLLAVQRDDGSWGGPDGYGVAPTLSAAEALLAVQDAECTRAAHRGLAWLSVRLPQMKALPDLAALDLTVPHLLDLLAGHPGGRRYGTLALPAELASPRLARLRAALTAGQVLPDKLTHALEVVAAQTAGLQQPSSDGSLGASPAATAAWLAAHRDSGADPGQVAAATWQLNQVATRYGGPVPVGLPITVFERGWVLSWLARTGVAITPPPEMLAGLRASIGPHGASAGPGLPADADTTAVALYALLLCGLAVEPSCLARFDTGEHFVTWPGEDGRSVSVNAHVLDAYLGWLTVRPADRDRYGPVVARLAAWILATQHQDGHWEDRWHASPYYATLAATLPLAHLAHLAHRDASTGSRAQAAAAIGRAQRWTLATQRADGGWGRWQSTAEESAYAVLMLLSTPCDISARAAARRCLPLLISTVHDHDHPPLWHDKDLYSPSGIIRAAIIAAVHSISGRRPGHQ